MHDLKQRAVQTMLRLMLCFSLCVALSGSAGAFGTHLGLGLSAPAAKVAVTITPPEATIPPPINAGQYRVGKVGQSLQAYMGLRGTATAAYGQYGANTSVDAVQANLTRQEMGLAYVRPFQKYSVSGVPANRATDASSVNAQDFTIRIDNYAVGGTNLCSRFGAANVAAGKYWWNDDDNTATTGNPLDVANSPGPLARQAAAGLSGFHVDEIEWDQGTNDITSVVNAANIAVYEADELALFDYLRAANANGNTPITIKPLSIDNTAIDNGTQNIRDTQMRALSKRANVFILPSYTIRFALAYRYASSSYSPSSTTVTGSGFNGANGISKYDILRSDPRLASTLPETDYATAAAGYSSFVLNSLPLGTISNDNLWREDGVHPYPGDNTNNAQPYDTDPLGGTNYTQFNLADGFYKTASRYAHASARIRQYTAGRIWGPQVTGVVAVAGNAYVDLPVQQDQGTALQPAPGGTVANSGFFFYVAVNGTQKPVSSPTINGNSIRVFFSGELSSGQTVAVTVGYGACNRRGFKNYINDNATPAMDLAPTSPINNPNMSVVVP